MSIASIMAAATKEGQARLAEIGGAARGAPTFTGPDGRPYIGVFRAANAFEQAAVGSEMQQNGFTDAEVSILTATKAQFASAPLSWRRANIHRISPAQKFLIASITTSDEWLYSFALIFRQGSA